MEQQQLFCVHKKCWTLACLSSDKEVAGGWKTAWESTTNSTAHASVNHTEPILTDAVNSVPKTHVSNRSSLVADVENSIEEVDAKRAKERSTSENGPVRNVPQLSDIQKAQANLKKSSIKESGVQPVPKLEKEIRREHISKGTIGRNVQELPNTAADNDHGSACILKNENPSPAVAVGKQTQETRKISEAHKKSLFDSDSDSDSDIFTVVRRPIQHPVHVASLTSQNTKTAKPTVERRGQQGTDQPNSLLKPQTSTAKSASGNVSPAAPKKVPESAPKKKGLFDSDSSDLDELFSSFSKGDANGATRRSPNQTLNVPHSSRLLDETESEDDYIFTEAMRVVSQHKSLEESTSSRSNPSTKPSLSNRSSLVADVENSIEEVDAKRAKERSISENGPVRKVPQLGDIQKDQFNFKKSSIKESGVQPVPKLEKEIRREHISEGTIGRSIQELTNTASDKDHGSTCIMFNNTSIKEVSEAPKKSLFASRGDSDWDLFTVVRRSIQHDVHIAPVMPQKTTTANVSVEGRCQKDADQSCYLLKPPTDSTAISSAYVYDHKGPILIDPTKTGFTCAKHPNRTKKLLNKSTQVAHSHFCSDGSIFSKHRFRFGSNGWVTRPSKAEQIKKRPVLSMTEAVSVVGFPTENDLKNMTVNLATIKTDSICVEPKSSSEGPRVVRACGRNVPYLSFSEALLFLEMKNSKRPIC